MLPRLPAYSGPYTVGTVDLEVPVSHLSSPAPPPQGSDIPTIKTRIFYPCESRKKKVKPAYWVPTPQWEYLQAFAAFVGASSRLSNAIAYSSWFIRSTTLPAVRNAPLADPPVGRWPVLVFSHGLGGSRNTYSQICGLIASYGVVVAAPEHRDGSAPITFICNDEGVPWRSIRYQSISHQPSPEACAARSSQLRVRLWELGCLHDLLLRLDLGDHIPNYSMAEDDGDAATVLAAFSAKLDVREPGKIIWAGHSFGAATVVQFIKSVFYGRPKGMQTFEPLYNPSRESSPVKQVTPASVVILLDLWTLPLLDQNTDWLYKQPLPSYQDPNHSGSNVLAVLSEAFYKWNANLVQTKKIISPSIKTSQSQRAHIFYAQNSAHLSQSDFGVLFPWVTRLVLKAQDPERILRLNTRAVLEVLRRNGMVVAPTSDVDLEKHSKSARSKKPSPREAETAKSLGAETSDEAILRRDGCVRGWIALDLEFETLPGEGANREIPETAQPIDAVIEEEMGA